MVINILSWWLSSSDFLIKVIFWSKWFSDQSDFLSKWFFHQHDFLIKVIFLSKWFSYQSDFFIKVNIQFSDFLIIVTIKAQLCSCQKLPLSVFGFRWFIGVLVSVICCVMPTVNPKLIWKSSTKVLQCSAMNFMAKMAQICYKSKRGQQQLLPSAAGFAAAAEIAELFQSSCSCCGKNAAFVAAGN